MVAMGLAKKEEDAPHYWSYRALLEDKKRCLSKIPTLPHEVCNSLRQEGEDAQISCRALDELKRHHRKTLEKQWDTRGFKTPPHQFESDENRPHHSQKEFAEKKKAMKTDVRRPARARTTSPAPSMSASERMARGIDSDWGGGQKRRQGTVNKLIEASADGPAMGQAAAQKLWAHPAPTMIQLMQPGDVMERRHSTERAALRERRPSTEPHDSQEVLAWKKKFHASKLHARPKGRAQSARELRGSQAGSEVSSVSSSRRVDPASIAYRGQYPYGESAGQAWPNGRSDPKKVGRYKSQAYLSIDKRRHAANVDGDAANQRAREREKQLTENANVEYDEQGFIKPDFTAQTEKYRSHRALSQHKRRHLANLKEGSDDGQSEFSPRSVRGVAQGPPQTSKGKEHLFTSYNSLEYGKRGHVVSLSAVQLPKKAKSETDGDGSESSCDVGKGISRMMARHKPGTVSTSHVEFLLKKKNHATGVHTTPKPPDWKPDFDDEEDIGLALMEKRSEENPHNSCKAFALKKKYHQTGVHVTDTSRLHPEKLKAPVLTAAEPVMVSQRKLNSLKKKQQFAHDPEHRERPKNRTLPTAPVPRNGQWTPQHVSD